MNSKREACGKETTWETQG